MKRQQAQNIDNTTQTTNNPHPPQHRSQPLRLAWVHKECIMSSKSLGHARPRKNRLSTLKTSYRTAVTHRRTYYTTSIHYITTLNTRSNFTLHRGFDQAPNVNVLRGGSIRLTSLQQARGICPAASSYRCDTCCLPRCANRQPGSTHVYNIADARCVIRVQRLHRKA